MFELPPMKYYCGWHLWCKASKKHDGHPCCKTKTTNIKFRHSSCVGHASYQISQYIYNVMNNAYNETNWEGVAIFLWKQKKNF
jgi:hypothetical protein